MDAIPTNVDPLCWRNCPFDPLESVTIPVGALVRSLKLPENVDKPVSAEPSPWNEVAVMIPEVLTLPVVPIPALIPVSAEPSPLKDVAVRTPVTTLVMNPAPFAS